MATFINALLAVTLVTLCMLSVFVQSGSALQCYSCNSLDNGLCGEEFDASKLTEVERRHFLVECTDIPLNLRKLNITQQSVCRKLITKSGGHRVFSRMCFFEEKGKAADSCAHESKLLQPIVTIEFCESCTEDGCNSGSYLLPLVTLMALPLLAIFRQ